MTDPPIIQYTAFWNSAKVIKCHRSLCFPSVCVLWIPKSLVILLVAVALTMHKDCVVAGADAAENGLCHDDVGEQNK